MDYGKVVNEIFSQIKGARFDIRIWDSRLFKYGEKKDKPVFTLIFEDENAAKRLLSEGALGFGEAYMEGKLKIQGDIDAYLRLRHQFKNIKPSVRMVVASLLAKKQIHTTTKEQISYHYDLGNEFFDKFLDKQTTSYSCALYREPNQKLGEAQQEKIKFICNLLDLPPNSTILDLGSGWGGFANYAAQNHKWNIEGYTLSNKQLKYSKDLTSKNKLSKRVNFKYKDMLTELPNKQYDAVVMIESIEHVGKERLASYFDDLYKLVKPGGSLYIQATGQYRARRVDKFITKYVFPGGYLPTYKELVELPISAGFRISILRDDTDDYIRTMDTWIGSIETNKRFIENEYGESFYRLWELWTHGAKISFEVGYMSLFRLHFKKPKD